MYVVDLSAPQAHLNSAYSAIKMRLRRILLHLVYRGFFSFFVFEESILKNRLFFFYRVGPGYLT